MSKTRKRPYSFTEGITSFSDKAARVREISDTRDQSRGLLDTTRIIDLTVAELLAAKAILQHGGVLEIWETPKRWVPASPYQCAIDLKSRVLGHLPPHLQEVAEKGADDSLETARLLRLVDAAVIKISRYLLICRTSGVGLRRSAHQPLDPTTILQLASGIMPAMAAKGIEKQYQNPAEGAERLFARLDRQDVPKSSRAGRLWMSELKRLVTLKERGLWDTDAPELSTASKTTAVLGARETPPAPDKREPHRPLPDDYVSEMGRKSAWIIENLGPSVINALEGLASVLKTSASAETRAGEGFVTSFVWRDAQGQPIDQLPFPIRLNRRGQRTQTEETATVWPPRLATQLQGLAKLLQTAHIFVLGLSMGARRTEVVTLRRDCVAYAKDNQRYANGRTFKLVQSADGAEREWVLPEFALQALEQQVRLVNAVDRVSSSKAAAEGLASGVHMWALLGGGAHDRSQPLSAVRLNLDLIAFATDLEMSTAPGGQPLRSHRLRKTLARLGALAIVESPKVLLDVFGHRSFEMTMHYILEDKDLRAEIETIARELRVMRATSVVEEMFAAEEAAEAIGNTSGTPASTEPSLGGFGGLAAVGIRDAAWAERAKVHRRGETWGAENVHDLALMLTMQGTAWQVVRPGVVCTKQATQVGPCSRKKGHPEPARCQNQCDHRLEEAWHREDVDGSISDSLRMYVEAGETGEDLAQSLWREQVLVNLPRFPDLQEKWMANPIVKSFFEAEEHAG